jgi:hypothetical protein
MIEARVHDFRIDARLRRVCKDQMQDCVGMDIYEGDETNVNICLQVRAVPACSVDAGVQINDRTCVVHVTAGAA